MAKQKLTTTKNDPKEKSSNKNPMQDENLELKNKIEQLEKMIAELTTSKANTEVVKNQKLEPIDSEYIDIPLNKVVKVMSLYVGGLNLKTSENGKTFRFNNFGDIQPIMYNDLVQIMNHQHRFAKEGYFLILDKDVIKAHTLEDDYKKLLDAKQIQNILDYDDETISQFFKSTTQNIRESIISIVVNKINSETGIDKNKLHLLSELYGADLFAYARGDYETLLNNNIKF